METRADAPAGHDAQGPGHDCSDAMHSTGGQGNGVLKSVSRTRDTAEVIAETGFLQSPPVGSPSPRHANGAEESATDKDDEGAAVGARAQSEEACCTRNMKTLGLTAALFATITVAQCFGAIAAQSITLLLDCISMGVDAGTYVGNMFVEWRRNTRWHRPLELIVAAVSLTLLILFTALELQEVLDTLWDGGDSKNSKEVNGYIILGFALGGVVFDLVSLNSFRKNHKKTQSGKQMNMWTALLHVAADLLRSLTTMVLSLLIIFGGTDGTLADAWAGLVVGATILLGAAAGVLGWIRKLVKYVREECGQARTFQRDSNPNSAPDPI